MAKRRKARRNPIQTTGALIINPRRRGARKARKARRNPLRYRTNARRTNRRVPARRRNSLVVRRNRRTARRNPLRFRTNKRRTHRRSRRSNPLRYRANPRRRSRKHARRAPIYKLNRRRNGRRSHARRYNRRRNGTARNMLSKIPVVGGVLAKVFGFFPYALAGAVGVEPTILAAKFLGTYLPSIPSSIFYAGTGLILAALVHNFLPISADLRSKLAIGIASGGAAVAYYKWRTGSDGDMGTETAGLTMAGVHGWADGGAWAVRPY